jgi:tRNA-Thr(GGU) m(6)t(6)A37 methyltransferase TsaA
MKEVIFKPVGVVHTKATSEAIKSRVPGIESVVEVFPDFEPALEGLETHSHIFVLGYFHELRPEQIGPLKVKPRALLRFGVKPEDLPTVGVFSLDSPTRPNPIGLALVPLNKREANMLHVTGLDFFDGTPVLDIKPYQDSYRVDDYKLPEWPARLLREGKKAKEHPST